MGMIKLSFLSLLLFANFTIAGSGLQTAIKLVDEMNKTETTYRKSLTDLVSMVEKLKKAESGATWSFTLPAAREKIKNDNLAIVALVNSAKSLIEGSKFINGLFSYLETDLKKEDMKNIEQSIAAIQKYFDNKTLFYNPYLNFSKSYLSSYNAILPLNKTDKEKSNFQFLLIAPIQRLPRYELLFKGLADKINEENNPKFSNVVANVNKLKSQLSKQILELQKAFPASTVSP